MAPQGFAPSGNKPTKDSWPNKVRVFIHTGEVSGDLQGGLLTSALYRQAKAKRHRPPGAGRWRGHRMEEAGADDHLQHR